MAVITPAIGIQSGSHSAQAFRQLLSAVVGQDVETFANSISAVGPGHGLVKSGDLAVSEKGTPDMSVDVAAGICLITGDQSLAQGVYAFTNDATVNIAITTADGTNPRWDLVCAQIRDNTEDAGGNDDARLVVVDGTAAASPADPTIPDGCLVLARVVVAAGVSSVVDANITALASTCQGSHWNTAWGVVGYASVTSNQSGVTSIADRTGLSVTWAAVTGRQYRTTVTTTGVIDSGAGWMSAVITDGSDVQKAGITAEMPSTGSYASAVTMAIESGISGSATRKARVQAESSSTFVATATAPAHIIVEDIGPA